MDRRYKLMKLNLCETPVLSRVTTFRFCFAFGLMVVMAASPALAQTWQARPASGDWNTAANWVGGVVPNSPSASANFALSSGTLVSLSASVAVDDITFTPGGSGYTITVNPQKTLTINSGIFNDSGLTQNLVTAIAGTKKAVNGQIIFTGSATAGSNVVITNEGGYNINESGGSTIFNDNSSAGSATVISKGAQLYIAKSGSTTFNDNATAATATLIAAASATSQAPGGIVTFNGHSTAASATLTAAGATSGSDSYGGTVFFNDYATAASATLTSNGGAANASNDRGGGTINFSGHSSAADAMLTANGGSGNPYEAGQNGTISFGDDATAGNATLIANPGYGYVSGPSRAISETINQGGSILFGGHATAGNATLTAKSGDGLSSGTTKYNGGIDFHDNSTAGNATLTAEGGVAGGYGGTITFFENSTVGNATLVAEGGSGVGGEIIFYDNATAGSNTLIAEGGSGVAGGGKILLENKNVNQDTRIIINGNSTLDISAVDLDLLSIGVKLYSINGSGNVILGDHDLILADDGISNISGVISGNGKLNVNNSSVTLSGSNTYSGGTEISPNGYVCTDNPSAFGPGTVNISQATLTPLGLLHISKLELEGEQGQYWMLLETNVNITLGTTSGTSASGYLDIDNLQCQKSAAGLLFNCTSGSNFMPNTLYPVMYTGQGSGVYIDATDLNGMQATVTGWIFGNSVWSIGYYEHPGDDYWLTNPVSGDWGTAVNWGMGTPSGASSNIDFAYSTITGVSVNTDALVNSINFTQQATPYTLTVAPGKTLTVSGTGITNVSGTTQTFQTGVNSTASGTISFTNSAKVGDHISFINQGAAVNGAYGGETQFSNSSNAGGGSYSAEGGAVAGAHGGSVVFNDTASAGTATLVANGGAVNGANGGGIYFNGQSDAATASLALHGNGFLDLSGHSAAGLKFGSITGEGNILLGASTLIFSGSSNFSGVIQDGGGKGGTGGAVAVQSGAQTVTLSGSSSYSGGTTLYSGVLQTENENALGTGAVTLNAGGTLAPEGQLYLGSLLWYGGSIDMTLGTSSSFLQINGDLVDKAWGGMFNFTEGSGFNLNTTYTLATVSGSDSFTASDLSGNAIDGVDPTFSIIGNKLNVSFTLSDPTDQVWLSVPGSGDWNTTENWTTGSAGGPPNSASATAIFQQSSVTDVSISSNTKVSGIQFLSGADAFTLNVTPGSKLTISGTGIINDAGNAQNFVTGADAEGNISRIIFTNSATAGANAIFTNNGGIVAGGLGGNVTFHNTSSAGSSTFVNNGGSASDARGGSTVFMDDSSAGSATLIANGGTNGGLGGGIYFFGNSDGGTASVEVNGNGFLEISGLSIRTTNLGSIEGDGNIFLGSNTLNVGGNGKTTTFSGVIQDGGESLGTGGVLMLSGGSLTLSGSNTYSGGTVINGGALRLEGAGTLGSANATLTVNGGVLDLNGVNLGVGNFTGTGGTVLNSHIGTRALFTLGNDDQGGGNYAGVIADNAGTGGTLALLKVGSGSIILSGSNTYSGGSTLSAGTLVVGGNHALGSGKVLLGDANTAANQSGPALLIGGAFTISNAITISENAGGYTIGGSTDNNAAFSGLVTLNNSLTVTQVLTTGSNALDLAGGITGGSNGNQTVTFSGPGKINVSGIISDNGASNQVGIQLIGGALTLSGSNTYGGGTVVDSGTLTVDNNGTTTHGALQGVVTTNGGAVTTSAPTEDGSFISTSIKPGSTHFIGIASAGSATLIANGGDAGSRGGGIYFDDSSDGGTARTILNGNGFLDISNHATGGVALGSIEGNGYVDLGANTLVVGGNDLSTEFSGVIFDSISLSGSGAGGSFTKTGAGTLTLSGTNFYSGHTLVEEGTLVLTHNLALVNSAIDTSGAGVIHLGGGVTAPTFGGLVGGADLASVITAGYSAITGLTLNPGAGFSNSYSGVIADGAAGMTLTMTGLGTQILSGSNTYGGGTTLSSGTLVAGNNHAFGGEAILLGDANTIANPSTPTLLIGGAFTVSNPITVTAYETAGCYTIGGSTDSNATFAGPVTLNHALVVTQAANAGGNALNLAGAIAAGTNGGQVLYLAGPGNINISGVLSDNGASNPLGVEVGGGAVTLSSSNRYSGGTGVDGGSLTVDNNGTTTHGTLGSGLVVVNGGSSSDLGSTGGALYFKGISSAGNLTLVATGGTRGYAGGGIYLNDASDGGTARVVLYGNADLDVSGRSISSVSVGSIEGDGNVLLGANTLTVGGNNLDTLFSGVIQDGGSGSGTGGSIIKTGTGLLMLTGTSTYTGDTTVNSGALVVNGFIAGNVNLAGGVLGGTGQIAGNLQNASLLSPGNSPGLLTVGGDYTQTSAGSLLIQLASSTAFDKLGIGGMAKLDGTLQVAFVDQFRPYIGETFTFLTADAGITGTLSTLDTGYVIKMSLSYESKSVTLVATQGLFADVAGLTPNEHAVAKALDKVVNASATADLVRYLDGIPETGIPRELEKIVPTDLITMFDASIASAQVQAVNLERRMEEIRGGAAGFSASGLSLSDSHGTRSVNGNADGKQPIGKDGKPLAATPISDRWGFFIAGSGEFVDEGNTASALGTNFITGGLTTGADCRLGEHAAMGVTAGYANTSSNGRGDGSVKIDSGKAGLYATVFDGGFYVNSALGGGINSYNTKRDTLGGISRGDADGNDFNALLGTGYTYQRDGLSTGPTASMRYSWVGIDGFTEHGSLAPLQVGDQSEASLKSTAGWQASYAFQVDQIGITPQIRAQWQHEYLDASRGIGASFLPGGAFTVKGPDIGRDSLLLDAGATFQLTRTQGIYTYYTGDLGRANYTSHSITCGVEVTF